MLRALEAAVTDSPVGGFFARISGAKNSTTHQTVLYSHGCRTPLCESNNREEGCLLVVYLIFSFLVSVMASVAAYYICKWLGRNSDND